MTINKTTISKKCDDASVIVAALYNVTPDYVRKVVNGKRTSPKILECYHQYREGKSNLIKSIEKQISI